MPNRLRGVLVTSETGHDPRVYLVRNKKKHWIVSQQVIASLGFQWDDINRVSPEKIESLVAGYPYTSVQQKIYDSDDFIYCIEETWSDDHAIGLTGWAVGKKTPLTSLSIEIDGKKKKIEHWVKKPEIYDYFSANTAFPVKENCGFMAIVYRDKEHEFSFRANSRARGTALGYTTASTQKPAFPDFPTAKNLEKKFRDIVNKNHLTVLEVGSRISPGGTNKRLFFKKAAAYTGIDYLPGKTVDVVGDAHELRKHFKKRFDAVYSDSVLEHLAMPWKAVIEMNKVLKKGGYAYHSAPACWIPHDMPWDFWRFSDAGMKALFSKPFGFKVIDVEYTAPVNVHVAGKVDDAYARFPMSPAFGFITVLAQKVAEIDRRKIRFNTALQDVVGEDGSYPEWTD